MTAGPCEVGGGNGEAGEKWRGVQRVPWHELVKSGWIHGNDTRVSEIDDVKIAATRGGVTRISTVFCSVLFWCIAADDDFAQALCAIGMVHVSRLKCVLRRHVLRDLYQALRICCQRVEDA